MKFRKSNKLLKEALRYIPSGAQTFSKSFQQFPQGHSPIFLSHGNGGKVWDIDGNEFIDLICGLLPIIIGYNDREINNAVVRQMNKGISFSLSTSLEVELSKMLCDIIPSAEMVRLGKTGSDVNTAAIRVARAYTKKENIIAIGYHGWHDWYVGATTRDLGIPKSIRKLTHKVGYNDLDEVESIFKKLNNNIACIIMEPMNIEEPKKGYLEGIRKLVTKKKSLLIFDEVVTGFRFHLGGAQKYFNVTPDMSTFGKALGNGLPISALVGKKKYMSLMNEIFFSGTFNGECLSIAAAIEVIKKIKKKNVIKKIWESGNFLTESVNQLITKLNLQDIIELKGKDCWKLLKFNNYKNIKSSEISTYFTKEMIRYGILISGSHNICFNHTRDDLVKITAAYKNVLKDLKFQIDSNTLIKNLNCPVINPVFKPRKY